MMRRTVWAWVLGCAACMEEPEGAVLDRDEGALDTGGYAIAPMIFNGASSVERSVVALIDIQGTLICSGTAVRQDLILTAAHCMDGIQLTEVLEGSSAAAPRRRYPVSAALMHPAYNPVTLDNDIGAVLLGTPFRGPISRIGLPQAGLGQVPVGSSLRVVGFGTDQNNLQGLRREANVTLSFVQPRLAIASNTAAGVCPGDSGGPLIANIGGRNRAVGVVVGILPPPNPVANPCVGDGIYTRVDAYMAWLSTL